MRVCSEVFADRAYVSHNQLQSRTEKGAVLSDAEKIKKQIDGFTISEVRDIHGNKHTIEVDTLCLHSDTPEAVIIAQILHNHLTDNDVHISATS